MAVASDLLDRRAAYALPVLLVNAPSLGQTTYLAGFASGRVAPRLTRRSGASDDVLDSGATSSSGRAL